MFKPDQKNPNRIRDFQNSFSGGMRRDIDPTKLGEDEYTLLVNARARTGSPRPIKLPLQITAGVPANSSNFQGLYGAGQYLILFASGRAYFRDFSSASSSFSNLPGPLEMNANVDRIYAELVPASTINFSRSISDPNNKESSINLTTAVNGSPQCLVVQDGLTQPFIVKSDGSSRVTKNFDGWTLDDREYVPVGKQMMMGDDGKLYIVSPSGREIYHSVTGRPLDFCIAVTSSGNKLASEAEGGATALSYRADYDEVTAIGKINDEGFYIGTNKNSYAISKTDRKIYGEPVFRRTFLFSTGPLNNFSLCDILGDTALIDFSSIRSFNAVQQFKVEGKNSPFSKEIQPLLDGIIQSATAAITFDNYALFSVYTIHGPAILVYDTLIEKWVAIDIYPGVGLIKQFAEIKLPESRQLFFITTDNKVYEAFVGSTAKAQLYTREFCTSDPEIEFKLDFVKTIFADAYESGSVTVTPFYDRKQGDFSTDILNRTVLTGSQFPISIPFGRALKDTVDNAIHKFPTSKTSWKVGFLIEWNCDATLTNISVVGNTFIAESGIESRARVFSTPVVAPQTVSSPENIPGFSGLGSGSGVDDGGNGEIELPVCPTPATPSLSLSVDSALVGITATVDEIGKSYRLYMRQSDSSIFEEIANGVLISNPTTVSVPELLPETTYYFYVTIDYGGLCGTRSSLVASGTTLVEPEDPNNDENPLYLIAPGTGFFVNYDHSCDFKYITAPTIFDFAHTKIPRISIGHYLYDGAGSTSWVNHIQGSNSFLQIKITCDIDPTQIFWEFKVYVYDNNGGLILVYRALSDTFATGSKTPARTYGNQHEQSCMVSGFIPNSLTLTGANS